jgi:hypothetical protein
MDPQNAKVIQKALEENNPNWKLPQRRVLKYVKKAVRPKASGSETGSTLEDDESVASNASSVAKVKGTGSSLRNVLKKKDSGGGGSSRFSFRRKKENVLPPDNISTKDTAVKETAPPSPLSPSSLLPSISQEEHDVDALIDKVEENDEEEEFNADDIIEQKTSEKTVEAMSIPEPKSAVLAEPEPEVEQASRAFNAYQDDNDGKPEPRNCAECAQCVIQ